MKEEQARKRAIEQAHEQAQSESEYYDEEEDEEPEEETKQPVQTEEPKRKGLGFFEAMAKLNASGIV